MAAVLAGEVPVPGTGRGNVIARIQALANELAGAPAGLSEQINYVFDTAAADQVTDGERRRWAVRDLETLRAAGQALAQEEDASIATVMEALTYRVATRAPLADEPDDPRVAIMTLHSAKGLEADAIVIAGVADQTVLD